MKNKYPDFKVTCFVIAKDLDDELKEWLKQDWIEVGVHGYDHDYPPECERPDKEERIRKSFDILKPLLPQRYGFRAPGHQITGTTYPLLRQMGFWWIAHETRIQPLKDIERFTNDTIINSHIYEQFNYELESDVQFKFITEGFA